MTAKMPLPALDRPALAAELIVANAPDPVFVCDLKGKILEVNNAVSQLLGLRRDEVLEQSLSRFLSLQETREFVAAVREVVERGVTRNARLHPRSASGEVIPTTLNASALRDADGVVIGVIGILRDMRELDKARRHAEAANQAKDQFLAMVSHELRTPLTAMLGWARMLRGGILDAATAERALEVIERNTTLQAQLIDDLLDLSRTITGKLQLELRVIDPVGVVQAAIEAVQALADAKSITLKVVLDPSVGPAVGDPQRLQQVVWNLLSNGIKFTPPHGVVELELDQTDSMARITVRDTGPGITPDLLPHMFEPFHQAKEARRQGGLGLGLAIVQHIVTLHGGSVRAASPGEGQGATFVVEVPRARERFEQIDPERVPRPGSDNGTRHRLTSLAGIQVLVVDDEPDARELLTAILQRAGADVAAASSTGEALQMLQQRKVDILISDIGMPEEDGYTLIKKVRTLDADNGAEIPAVALTANARPEDRSRALAAGFQSYMVKPIDPAEFTSVVADVIRA